MDLPSLNQLSFNDLPTDHSLDSIIHLLIHHMEFIILIAYREIRDQDGQKS